MARVRITYWQEIPVLVTARDAADEVTIPLSSRFQDLVDAVAMLLGLSDAEDYLARWQPGPEEERPGGADAAARAVAGELEEQFAEIRARSFQPGSVTE
ncbi:MAG TPA: virulence factor [Methylomirabilota bacterium]|jgi:hypothetical protein|nr:virulence factor [Methylomirabilota bacterium]